MNYIDNGIDKKGTLKTYKGKIVVDNFEVGNIIKPVLINNGFDLIVKPLLSPELHYQSGEEIEVFKIEPTV